MSLLEVDGLTVGLERSPHSLLREVGFTVEPGEVMGLVGESGSGKTMASLAIMGLLPSGIEQRGGTVRLEGRDLMDSGTGEIHRTANQMTMIFQDPRSALNPTMRIGRQIARVIETNQNASREKARAAALAALSHVGIPGAKRVFRAYPHQLSGGMCQRVMIAMALACKPRILIADEPTTALDVTIQAQIFDLINDLVQETGCGVLFITHDLGAIAEMCDRVTVLYGGQVMETGSLRGVFTQPLHPYTQFLFDAVEREVDPRVEEKGANFALAGCRFGHRCPYVFEACGQFPPLRTVIEGHRSACFLPEEGRIGAP
ncbi:MAG: ABC transporter ATP-binding protein [Acidimicrobiia bacterium]|nr:ABC transporter ATP-binding protein [Acidimicrobiia bacterium]MDH3397756.1 ABC transporter ATP-binding protein [Acidimicrobiia bacterium]